MAVSYTVSTINSAGTNGGTNLYYKEVTVTAAVGDLIVAYGVSAEANSSTASTISKSAGTGAIGAWTSIFESHVASNCAYIASYATCTTAGTITIRCLMSCSVSNAFVTAAAWLIPAAEWSGTLATATFSADTDSLVSLIVASTGNVLYSGGDWTALAPGTTTTPTGGTIDSSFNDNGTTYTELGIHWGSQTAGTRSYGMSGLTSRKYTGAAVAVPAGSGGVTGTLATTLDDSVLAASATETIPGTLATTLDDSVVAGNGWASATGSLATTLDDSVLAANATETIPGTFATTLDDSALAATGSETIAGTLASTLDDSVLAASGWASATGTLTTTLDDSALAANAVETISGSLATTLDDSVFAASGTSVSGVTGTLATTLDDSVLAASGTVTATNVTGTLALMLDDSVLAAAGAETIPGSLALTLADAVLAAAGTSGTYLPLVDANHIRAVPVRLTVRSVPTRGSIRTVPARPSIRSVT